MGRHRESYMRSLAAPASLELQTAEAVDRHLAKLGKNWRLDWTGDGWRLLQRISGDEWAEVRLYRSLDEFARDQNVDR